MVVAVVAPLPAPAPDLAQAHGTLQAAARARSIVPVTLAGHLVDAAAAGYDLDWGALAQDAGLSQEVAEQVGNWAPVCFKKTRLMVAQGMAGAWWCQDEPWVTFGVHPGTRHIISQRGLAWPGGCHAAPSAVSAVRKALHASTSCFSRSFFHQGVLSVC